MNEILLIKSILLQALSQFSSRKNLFGNRHEVFFLNLEDGYFGCQVNESVEFLQIYELSRLCDGLQDCYMGSDELRKELKCSSESLQLIVKFDVNSNYFKTTVRAKMDRHARTECVSIISAIVTMALVAATARWPTRMSVNIGPAMCSRIARIL